jgi:23S rRNA (cytidine1920-2'-O)/16S rRNA (cytidine1409-2'-O)-methyltransferase
MTGRAAKMRADLLLHSRALAESREKARALILAGEVFSGERRVEKPGELLAVDAPLAVRAQLPYVSRGGVKLAAALDAFSIDPRGKTCLDVGASTGGFTDCLLKHGAAAVTAVDVGYGQLAWKIRNDPRVTVMERTNFRHLEPGSFPAPFDLAVADVSFISLTLILPGISASLRPGGEAVLLVKPQFEAGREAVGKGGIVRDPAAREGAVRKVAEAASALGFTVAGRIGSPLTGADGNVEYLLHLKRS